MPPLPAPTHWRPRLSRAATSAWYKLSSRDRTHCLREPAPAPSQRVRNGRWTRGRTWGVCGHKPLHLAQRTGTPADTGSPAWRLPAGCGSWGFASQNPGLPEGPSSHLRRGLDGVGAGSIGRSRLGPTFLGNKIIPGALWGKAPQSWGWWALQARGLLGRKQRGSFQATGGSRTRLQGVLRKVREGAACGIQIQEGVRVEWRRLRLPFCVHPGRRVCSRGRGAGWVRADVPYVQRKCHSHWSLRDGAQGVLSAENRHLLSVRGSLPSS